MIVEKHHFSKKINNKTNRNQKLISVFNSCHKGIHTLIVILFSHSLFDKTQEFQVF
jgi:hypothetical protein